MAILFCLLLGLLLALVDILVSEHGTDFIADLLGQMRVAEGNVHREARQFVRSRPGHGIQRRHLDGLSQALDHRFHWHLADVFLDQLNADYELVPRGTGGTPRSARRPNRGGGTPRWVKIALVLAFLIFVVPAAFHHFPIFLLVVVAVFLAMRRARSRRSWTAMFG